MASPLNRSRYQLWKEGHKSQVLKRRFASIKFAPININRVTESLKSIKTDPDWQDYLQRKVRKLPAKTGSSHLKIADKEIEVLENAQQSDVGKQAAKQQQFSTTLIVGVAHCPADIEVDHAGCEHQRAESNIPPPVKQVAGQYK